MAKRIGILTGGGDCPGLNAVIRAVTMTGILKYGYEVLGYMHGYRGLYENTYINLDLQTVSGILHRGGTILYTSNKDNLFQYHLMENGQKVVKDVSDVAVENLKKEGVEALIIVGGDGTLASSLKLEKKGVNVVGVPKTIDNDLEGTDFTFGFNSALNVAVEALDRLHTTAESHHRIMVLEVMGRYAGHIALHAGIAGSADIILIPEIPYSIEKIADKIKERVQLGKLFSIVVVAEGAKSVGGDYVVSKIVEDSPEKIRLGGIGQKIAEDLEKLIKDHEVRHTVLGHVQRGGNTSSFDRVLSTRFGVKAVDLVNEKKFGNMVCLKGEEVSYTPLENVVDKNRLVNIDGDVINAARSIGISFGD
jgi:ATP-dependent phosphofructokinase / diphosphate-dependent phosphofructokinase